MSGVHDGGATMLPPPDPSAGTVDRRDDGAVTDAGGADERRAGGGFEWPFESWRDAVEWWYQPLRERRTWMALGGLFLGTIAGPLAFAATLTIVLTVGGLSIVGIGLLLVVPAFAAINGLAVLERRRASLLGDPIAARRLDTSGGGWWSAIRSRVADASRWRQVVYLLLGVVAGPLAFAVGAAGWFFLWDLVFDRDSVATVLGQDVVVDSGVQFSFGALLFAVALAPAAARWTTLVARAVREYAAFFLGPDREAELTERVATLSTQREEILDAVAGERRRIERNLHDGVQQQLVALGIDIGRAEARLADDPDGARQLLEDAKTKVRSSIGELRLIGRGLHPAVLGDRGLDAALSAVVADAPIPISVEVSTEHDLPEHVAETAYYVVNESIANVLKYAKARSASVRVVDEPGLLPAVRIEVHDDGRGGADPSRGSGLAGIKARAEGVDGAFALSSPDGGPTVVTAVVPIRRSRAVDGDPSGAAGTGHGDSVTDRGAAT